LRAIQCNIAHDTQAIIALSKSCETAVDSPDLYSEDVTEVTSIVASIPEVRLNLNHVLQDFLKEHSRVVMDGRDIGTVIAPDADLKIYVTAGLEVRAQRRYNQLTLSGKNATMEDLLQKLAERDERDSTRKSAPLVIADDAVVLDTTNMPAEEVVEELLRNVSTSVIQENVL
jgi:cytidylate kinase